MVQQSIVLMDAAGRRRSPATMPGYLAGRAPHNKGMQYPPDPPRAEEIVLVMRQAGAGRHGLRIRPHSGPARSPPCRTAPGRCDGLFGVRCAGWASVATRSSCERQARPEGEDV
jgi:hypothetical protein